MVIARVALTPVRTRSIPGCANSSRLAPDMTVGDVYLDTQANPSPLDSPTWLPVAAAVLLIATCPSAHCTHQGGALQAQATGGVGMNFQQLQKYENASNRITAGQLFQLAELYGETRAVGLRGALSRPRPKAEDRATNG